MKLLATFCVLLILSTSALSWHRCNAPTRAGTCKTRVTDKLLPGQRSRFTNCRRHAITDSDCEWYQRKPVKHSNPCWRPAGSPAVEDCYYIDGDVTRPIPGSPSGKRKAK